MVVESGCTVAQVTPRGLVVSATPDELGNLRREYRACSSLRLPGFLQPELAAKLRERLERVWFAENAPRGNGPRHLCPDPAASGQVHVLFNRPPVLRFMEAVTGESPLLGVEGVVRCYDRELLPPLDWHADCGDPTRRVGISIQLSDGAYEGGLLRVRERGSDTVLAEYGRGAPGDAILFRIHPSVEHQAMAVLGEIRRTVFTGWFVTRVVLPFGTPHVSRPLYP